MLGTRASCGLLALLGLGTALTACGSKGGAAAQCSPGGDGTYVHALYDDLASYCLVHVDDGQVAVAGGALDYELNTPLFSDYAIKRRSVFTPPGTKIGYRPDGILDFPPGTILLKSFGFPKDFRDAASPITWVETRVIALGDDGTWRAASYAWDDAQKSAPEAPGGTVREIDFVDAQGAAQHSSYLIPSINQCPKCHGSNGALVPIGLRAAQLNRDHAYADGTANQLARWTASGVLEGAPAADAAPRMPAWDDVTLGADVRARSYLDGNCAYCHNASGEARTTGLFLAMTESDPAHTGICKPPVAAGQASAGLQYDILPGQPDQSILVHRMEAVEPSIAMPEIGRSLVHAEAVTVVRAWITGLDGGCQ
jgi:uncharacterized repeat protein (TIGR03806 family)